MESYNTIRKPTKKRAQWSEENLRDALEAIRNGTSISQASNRYNIPRTTLGLHYRKQNFDKRLGRYSVLSPEQESDLVKRIHRLAEIGMPITSRMVRRSVFSYAAALNIPNPFSKESELAGRKWLKLFFGRHPDVTQRKAQQMNPARAQKMNKFIVNDYFLKLEKVMTKLELFNKPGCVYNMDEKGCRLTIHKQQKVLAKTGAKRVHLTAPEHGENVSIVGCGNALGQAVPPFVLFKGRRLKAEWGDHLPPGSQVMVTEKGSMTNESFIAWLAHFAKYKNSGPTLLIFDGAKSHLDVSIVEAADNHDITLFCLPSNTTHELQPMDKAVFRSFEAFWDQEVLHFLVTQPGKPLTKMRFGEIFSKVWLKAMTPSNIISGFKATGIFPFCPDVIPDSAFAPSLITHVEEKSLENSGNGEANHAIEATASNNNNFSPIPGPSGIILHKKKIYSGSDSESDSDNTDNEPLSKFLVSSKQNTDEQLDTRTPQKANLDMSFTDVGFLVTPEIKVSAAKRKPAINSRAQEVTKDLFSRSTHLKSKKVSGKKKSKIVESWFCFVCSEDRQADMRLCAICHRYVHEECVGLTKEDNDIFKCPNCCY